MKRFGAIIAIATLLIVGGGIYLFSRNSASEQTATPLSAPTSYEYYWGNGCPHCKNVEDFLNSWQGKDKIKLEKFEVWNNRENARRMKARAEACNLPQKDLAVPFLVTLEGKCIGGDEPIIQFFKDLKF